MGMAANQNTYWKRQYLELKELVECVRILDGQVRFCLTPLPELLQEIKRKRESAMGALFGHIGQEIGKQKGEMLQDIWERVLDEEKEKIVLAKEDWELLREMGKGLGYLDVEMQKRHLESNLAQLSARLPEREKKYKEREKVIRSFGFAAATLLLLILI